MSTKQETLKIPEVKFSKNGYEIRTEILSMAKSMVLEDFNAKFAGWQLTSKKDQNGQLVTSVVMPEFPGLDKILETAERMYGFVDNASKTKK